MSKIEVDLNDVFLWTDEDVVFSFENIHASEVEDGNKPPEPLTPDEVKLAMQKLINDDSVSSFIGEALQDIVQEIINNRE